MANGEALFDDESELALFRTVRDFILTLGEVQLLAHRTQVAFKASRQFARVWRPQKWVKGNPKHSITLSFGLDCQIADPRIKKATEPYPCRWTHHLVLTKETDFDDGVKAWLREAFAFASRPRSRRDR